MSGYIALKNVVFNGIGYTVGSTIPAEAVLPSRVPALLRNKTIAKSDSDAQTPAVSAETSQRAPETDNKVDLPIKTEDGVLGLPASREDIVKAVEVLQLKQEEAIAAVAEIESEDALIIIDACTKTQALKKAIRERVAALKSADKDDNETATSEGDNGDGEQ